MVQKRKGNKMFHWIHISNLPDKQSKQVLLFGIQTTSSSSSDSTSSKKRQQIFKRQHHFNVPHTTAKTTVLLNHNQKFNCVDKNEKIQKFDKDNDKITDKIPTFVSKDNFSDKKINQHSTNLIGVKKLAHISKCSYNNNNNIVNLPSNNLLTTNAAINTNVNNKQTFIDNNTDNTLYNKEIKQKTNSSDIVINENNKIVTNNRKNLTNKQLPNIRKINTNCLCNNLSKLYKIDETLKYNNNISLHRPRQNSIHKIVTTTTTSTTINNRHVFDNYLQYNVDDTKFPNKHLTFNHKQLIDNSEANNIKQNLIISKRNQLSKIKFLNDCGGMDRSVDSIGSCSLDVDAESTDFSDTSSSLNLCTPLSNKDFTKEFTTRIHERCQLGQITYQKAATVLDPASGKISTILAIDNNCSSIDKQQQHSTTNVANQLSLTTTSTSPAKKPSYLNLACCVNGYSNLTTYDSKFRQNINKSREVSPIRPITHTLQYNRGDGNYLVVPIPVALKKDSISPTSTIIAANNMDQQHTTLLSPDKRFYATPIKRQQIVDNKLSAMEQDCTDNATQFYKTTKIIASASASPTTILNSSANNSISSNNNSPKSFIQQRVERLYGPGALAQGFYSPARVRNNLSVLSERSQNNVDNSTTPSPKIFKSDTKQRTTTSTTNSTNVKQFSTINSSFGMNDEWENVNTTTTSSSMDEQSLPVLRHLRPEFRAQLPILSPKRATCKLNDINNTSPQTMSSLPSMPYSQTSTITLQQQTQTHHSSGIVVNGSNCNSSNLLSNSSVVLDTVNSSVNNMTLSENNKQNGCTSAKNTNNNINNNCTSSSDTSASNNKSLPMMAVSCNNTVVVTLNGGENIAKNLTGSSNTKMINNSMENGSCDSDNSDMHNNIKSVVTNGNDTKDGNYFLNIIKVERDRLLGLALETENDMEMLLQNTENQDEEMIGNLRSAAGKARLLVSQKIQQFEGLCKNSLNQLPDEKYRTTFEDLQGFWDMVLLQVDHVDSLFKEIDSYRKNNWKIPSSEPKPKLFVPQGAKLIKRPLAIKSTNGNQASIKPTSTDSNNSAANAKKIAASLAAQRRDAARKQLLELKRKNKNAKDQMDTQIDISINGSSCTSGVTNESS